MFAMERESDLDWELLSYCQHCWDLRLGLEGLGDEIFTMDFEDWIVSVVMES